MLRFMCCLPLFLWGAAHVQAQVQFPDERPKPYQPIKPLSVEHQRQRAALKEFGLGLLCVKEDRLVEALKAFERAAQLDPNAPAVFKVQAPLLVALERPDDALACLRQTLKLDPKDYEGWYMAARLCRGLGKHDEAKNALKKGLAVPAVAEHPEVAQQMHLDLAALHELADDHLAAAAALAKAAEILDHPEALLDHGPFQRDAILARAAETYERLGHMYRKAKKYEEALGAYQVAQKRFPETAARLNLNLAQLCHERGQFEPALAYLDHYLRLQPIFLEPYELKIDLLAKLHRQAAVVPWLEQACRTDPNNNGLKTLLAKNYVQSNQKEKAEAIFLAQAKDGPTPELYRDMFSLHGKTPVQQAPAVLATLNTTIARATARPPELGAAAQAKAMVQAIREERALSAALVEVAGKTPPETLKLQPDTYQLLAALADRARKFSEAERFFRLSLPDATPANEALLYGSLLRTLWKAHKYSAVIEVCRDGLKKAQATNHVLFYTDLARAQARLGQSKEALQDVDRALRLATDADRLAVRHLRVRILTNAEQYDAAERECRVLLEDYPQPADQLEIRYLLSNVFHAKKDLLKSEEQLKLILDQDPNNITANNDLGYLWADQNKHLDKAEAMIRKALDLEKRQRQLRRDSAAEEDHDNAAYVDSLGWVLYRTGKLEEACQELERAVRLPDGDDPTLWDHLGDVYRDLNRQDQARQAYQQSVRLFEEEARRDRDDRLQETRRKLKKLEIPAGSR